MNIRELRTLLVLAEERHFGRAAERIGMAQPQLSLMVRRLETEAGVTLFTRRPQVAPTEAGAVVLDTARRVLADFEAGTRRARAIAEGHAGMVRLGFSAVAMCSDLPALVRAASQDDPGLEFDLFEGTTQPLLERLERGALDIVVSREPGVGALQSIRFAADRVKLILPLGHPAAAADPIDPAHVAGARFSMFRRSDAPAYHDRILRWAEAVGLRPNVTLATESWIAGVALVATGLTFAFGTELLSRIAVPGVVYRDVAGEPLDVGFWMSWDPERLSPAARRFVERARATRAT